MATPTRKIGNLTHKDILAAASMDVPLVHGDTQHSTDFGTSGPSPAFRPNMSSSFMRSPQNLSSPLSRYGYGAQMPEDQIGYRPGSSLLGRGSEFPSAPQASRFNPGSFDPHTDMSFLSRRQNQSAPFSFPSAEHLRNQDHGYGSVHESETQESTLEQSPQGHNTREETPSNLANRVDDILQSFDLGLKTEELLARAPITQNGGYSREFVLSLEEHYREQLVTHITTVQEATQRRLLLKEDELTQLHETVREMHELFANKEKTLMDEIERLHADRQDNESKVKDEINSIQKQKDEEIEQLEKRHNQDLEKASVESEAAIKRVCEWARTQLIGLDSKLESQRIAFQKQLDSVESGKALEVSRIQVEKDQSVGEIRQLLALTEMKLLEARKEIEAINQARQDDLTTLRGQLEDCLKVIQEKDVEYSKSIQVLHKEFAQKEAELRKQMQQERLTREVDKQELQYQVELLREKIVKLQNYIRDAEQRYMAEIKHLTDENHRVISAFNNAQSQIQMDSQQYIKITNMARDYEREITILKNELLLTQNEERRLREENAEFRMEVTRLDKIIYGRNSSHAKVPASPKDRPPLK